MNMVYLIVLILMRITITTMNDNMVLNTVSALTEKVKWKFWAFIWLENKLESTVLYKGKWYIRIFSKFYMEFI